MSFIKTEAKEMKSDYLRNSAKKKIFFDLLKLFVIELKKKKNSH